MLPQTQPLLQGAYVLAEEMNTKVLNDLISHHLRRIGRRAEGDVEEIGQGT